MSWVRSPYWPRVNSLVSVTNAPAPGPVPGRPESGSLNPQTSTERIPIFSTERKTSGPNLKICRKNFQIPTLETPATEIWVTEEWRLKQRQNTGLAISREPSGIFPFRSRQVKWFLKARLYIWKNFFWRMCKFTRWEPRRAKWKYGEHQNKEHSIFPKRLNISKFRFRRSHCTWMGTCCLWKLFFYR